MPYINSLPISITPDTLTAPFPDDHALWLWRVLLVRLIEDITVFADREQRVIVIRDDDGITEITRCATPADVLAYALREIDYYAALGDDAWPRYALIHERRPT